MLVHGSVPQDRDEAIGRINPFESWRKGSPRKGLLFSDMRNRSGTTLQNAPAFRSDDGQRGNHRRRSGGGTAREFPQHTGLSPRKRTCFLQLSRGVYSRGRECKLPSFTVLTFVKQIIGRGVWLEERSFCRQGKSFRFSLCLSKVIV